MNKLHIHERICTSCSERINKCVRWCSQHLSNVHTCICIVLTTCQKCMHTLCKKCICTRACAHIQWCRKFFAMEAIANLSWVLREHRTGCRLPLVLSARPAVSTKPIARRCSLKKSVQTHASSMTRLPLRCCTSIIQSSALVQASSSLSMGRTRAWPQNLSPTNFYFRHGFRGLFSCY